jgi:hypothetical protein
MSLSRRSIVGVGVAPTGKRHYDSIMGKTRQISITLPEELIETIKLAVERGEARSVSSYIASRMAPEVVMDVLFAEWDADRGRPSVSGGQRVGRPRAGSRAG